MSLELVVGASAISMIFLWFAFKLEKQHVVLKLILIFMAISTLPLVPKAAHDGTTSCELLLFNTTRSFTDSQNFTELHTYNQSCINTSTQGSTTLLKLAVGFLRIFIVYFATYVFYHTFKQTMAYQRFIDRWKRRKN